MVAVQSISQSISQAKAEKLNAINPEIVKVSNGDPRTVITLKSLRNILKGEHIIVCGLAPSMLELENPQDYWTIGVNDIGRLFTPDFLIVINTSSTIRGERWEQVQKANPWCFVSHYNFPDVQHKYYVQFKLGTFGKARLFDEHIMDHSNNSPYVGVILAALLGASKIGLIGVDFTQDHFYRKSGVHKLNSRIGIINNHYRKAAEACEREGIEFVNLSKTSNIDTVKRGSIEDFRKACQG